MQEKYATDTAIAMSLVATTKTRTAKASLRYSLGPIGLRSLALSLR